MFDFGGGTLDISIIEHEGKGMFQVLATDGDPRLGGSDVDIEVAKLVIKMVRNHEDKRFDPLKTGRNHYKCLYSNYSCFFEYSKQFPPKLIDGTLAIRKVVTVSRELDH